MLRFLAGADAGARSRRSFAARLLLGAVIPDVLPAVGRRKAAGGASTRPGGRRGRGRGYTRLLVEGLLGYAEGVHRRGHPAVEHHLRDDFRDFFLGYPDVQRAGDVALDHLRAVSQHDQRGNGAKAAGLEVNGGAVVDFAIDHRVHQTHHLRGQFGHGCRRLRVVLRPVVPHTELGCGLVQVGHEVIRLVVFVRLAFQVGLIGTQIRVVFIVKSGSHNNALYPRPPP